MYSHCFCILEVQTNFKQIESIMHAISCLLFRTDLNEIIYAVKDRLVLNTGGRGGVLPYISYIGMCHPIGWGFCAVLV